VVGVVEAELRPVRIVECFSEEELHALAAVGELSEQGFGGAAEGGCDRLPDTVSEDLLDHQKL
jgi:hypothetical protein